MKKILLIIGLLISVNMMFAQTATMSVPDYDITGVAVGSTVLVDVKIDAISNLVYGFQVFLMYDDAKLLWQGGNTTPGIGVQAIHPNINGGVLNSDWTWNETNDQLAFSWLEPNFLAIGIAPGETLITLKFTLMAAVPAGTSVPISFGTVAKWNVTNKDDVKLEKGVTELYDENFGVYALTTVDGSVFVPNVTPAPVADFNADNLMPFVGAPVNFTDLSSNVPTSWAWDFGDLGTSVAQNPSHVYAAAGFYTVTLTATNAGGFDSEVKVNYINVQPVGPIVKTWTPQGGSTDWFSNANWTPPGVPTTEDVVIPGGKAINVIISGGAASTGMLTVNAGGGIEIQPTGSLTTNGMFDNNGELVISSDVNGFSGSFINIGGINSSLNTGSYSFNREIYTITNPVAPYGAQGGWHYIASPVNNHQTWDMFDYWVNEWLPVPQVWNHIGGAITPVGQPCIAGPNLPLLPTVAWSVKQDITYAGPINYLGYPDNCEVAYPGVGTMIPFNGPFTAVNTGLQPMINLVPGWNFIGNPYSASLNPGAFAWQAGTVQDAHYWNGATYVTWATSVPLELVPPTNGFFVQATAPSSLTFSGAERVHDLGIQYYKSDITNLLTLKATAQGNSYSDVTHVRFMEDKTAGFDSNGDAHKLLSSVEGVPQIYTRVGEEMLAINALPETETVPMGFTSVTSGTYTIEAIETSEFANVVLEDLANGVQTDLLTNSYSFDFTVGDNANRFVIHFTPLGTPELTAKSINIWANDHKIYVQAPATTGDIVVYNMMGQEVVRTSIEAGLNVIPMNDVNTYFIVKVIGSDVTETGKVFVK
jgi:PKD repeat protein